MDREVVYSQEGCTAHLVCFVSGKCTANLVCFETRKCRSERAPRTDRHCLLIRRMTASQSKSSPCLKLRLQSPEIEFKEFEPRFKSAKTRFKFSAGLNPETFDTILS